MNLLNSEPKLLGGSSVARLDQLQHLRSQSTRATFTVESEEDVSSRSRQVAIRSRRFGLNLMLLRLAQERGTSISLQSDHHGDEKIT